MEHRENKGVTKVLTREFQECYIGDNSKRKEQRERMTQQKMQAVVKSVTQGQLRNRIQVFEFDELFNVAMVAVLEAKKRHTVLNENIVATIARRNIFRWKIRNTDARSLPAGSAFYLYERGRVEVSVELPEEPSTDLAHWRRNERLRDLALVVEKIYSDTGLLEKRLMRTLMDGGSGRSLKRELKNIHFPLVENGRSRISIAFESLRTQFEEHGYR